MIMNKLMDEVAFRKAFDNMPDEIKFVPHYAWFVELYEASKESNIRETK